MKVSKVLRIDEDVYNQFKDLTISEGRLMGKMLEIMMLEYIKITKAIDEQIEKKDGEWFDGNKENCWYIFLDW